MTENNNHNRPFDPFAGFWSDMMDRMVPGTATSTPQSAEWVKQMRKPFFDAMAHYAEEFMRSEQFLVAMKQSMDNALAFRQQFDEFLTKNLHGMQMPSSSDADHIVLVVRGMEERLAEKIDNLNERIERLEQARDGVTGRDRVPKVADKRESRKRSKKR